mgnify:CR=1 FL=1
MVEIIINGWIMNIEVGKPHYDKRSVYGYYLLCFINGPLYFFHGNHEGDVEFEELEYTMN